MKTIRLSECFPYYETGLRPYKHQTIFCIVIHENQRSLSELIRRYNGPESSAVVAIIPRAQDGIVGRIDIAWRCRGTLNSAGNEVLHRTSVMHRSYDPSCYVLIFPRGEDRWRIQLMSATSTSASPSSSNTP